MKVDREAQVPLGSYQYYCNAESLRKLVPSMVDIRFLGRCILITVSLYSNGGGQLSLPQIKDLNPRSDSLRANDSIIFVHFDLSPTSLVDPLVEGGQDDGGPLGLPQEGKPIPPTSPDNLGGDCTACLASSDRFLPFESNPLGSNAH